MKKKAIVLLLASLCIIPLFGAKPKLTYNQQMLEDSKASLVISGPLAVVLFSISTPVVVMVGTVTVPAVLAIPALFGGAGAVGTAYYGWLVKKETMRKKSY